MQIDIQDAGKTIHGARILEDVNLTLTSGHIYGLQGPNGSGKTMLLRLIAGLIRPTVGRVVVDGQTLGKGFDFPPSMGLLLENPAFLPGYTGFQNLELLASIQNTVGENAIRQAIRDVGLDPDDKRKYRKYSLGMKQRLGIAAAIMERPALVLLDEPTNALDENGVEQICELIRRERDRGALILVASHDAAILDRLSDVIYTVYEGEVKEKASYPPPRMRPRRTETSYSGR